MSVIHDLRLAVRVLWKEKGFALTAVTTLAICIAVNAALFGIVRSVLLSPLPTPDSDRIVVMYNSYPKAGVERASNGVPDYYDRLRDLSDVFEEQAMYYGMGVTVGDSGSPQRLSGLAVTPSFFRLLKVEAGLGRTFTEDESKVGSESRVILSHSLWQSIYGGRQEALGQDLRINGKPFEIVGVMPSDFLFLDPSIRLWIPLAFTDEQKSDQNRHSNSWENIGRLRPGASLEQVRAKLDALTQANYEKFPYFKEPLLNAGYHVQAHFLKEEVVRDIRGVLYLLWGGGLVVLLIGAANIGNLVLARSSVRVKELCTRMALGAGLRRVSREVLIESTLLCAIGGAVGIVLGYFGLRAFTSSGMASFPRGSEISMDTIAVAVTLGLCAAVALAITLVQVIHGARADLNSIFREESRTGTVSRGTRITRNAVVAAQVAFAFVLLIGAGLLFESFRRVSAIDPGFRQPETLLTGRATLPSARYADDPAVRSFAHRALEQIRAIPGVLKAGITDSLPFSGRNSDSVMLAEGYQMQPGESLVSPTQIVVTAGYFEAMGMRLAEGRFIDESDVEDSLRTIVVDERLARKFWPNQSPLGKRLYFPTQRDDITAITDETVFYSVIGVVGAVKQNGLVDPNERVGTVYRSFEQSPDGALMFAIRASGDPALLVSAVRDRLTAIDPELPFYGAVSMSERMEESLTQRRTPMLLSLVFGAIALFLSAVGIYGVLAYVVAQRTREFGIRIALGSDNGTLFRLVLRQGLLVLVGGFAVGFSGLLALSGILAGLIYGVQPLSPTVILAVSALLAAVALSACAVPALRATRIDPVRALNV